MDIIVNLLDKTLSEENIQALTNDFNLAINNETDAFSELSSKEGFSGTKGDISVLGEIIITALSSGAVVSLFKVIKSYINRNSSLSIEITDNKGNSIKVNSSNIDTEKINNTISRLSTMINE